MIVVSFKHDQKEESKAFQDHCHLPGRTCGVIGIAAALSLDVDDRLKEQEFGTGFRD